MLIASRGAARCTYRHIRHIHLYSSTTDKWAVEKNKTTLLPHTFFFFFFNGDSYVSEIVCSTTGMNVSLQRVADRQTKAEGQTEM